MTADATSPVPAATDPGPAANEPGPEVALRRALASLPAYVPGARVAPGASAFKLSSNENPYPPLPSVLEAVRAAAGEMNRYPDMFATELTEAIADRLGVGADQVVCGTGSVAVLGHVLQAVCDPEDEVVFAWRSFEAYPIAVRLAGATAVQVPLDEEARLDLPAMAAAVTPRTKAVLVCSPNNPTGPAVTRDDLTTFLAAVPPDVLVVLDEAYLEFVRSAEVPDGLDVLARHPNVVVLRTFSKAYGLAGLRVGYSVSTARLASAIRTASTPFGVSHVAQVAALASLRAEDELHERVERVVAERGRLLAGLRGQGWDVPDAQGNFVWLALGERTAERGAEAAAAGVLVRPFPGEGMRVTVGEPEATDAFLRLTAGWR